MSIHASWVKSSLKLLLALSIPIAIAWFFLYSQDQANVEVENYRKEQKENPTSNSVVIKNYELKEVDDFNHIRWQLLSKQGQFAPNNKDVILDNVTVEYFDGPNVKMRIQAPCGQANQETRYVKLTGVDGKPVEAKGDGGKSCFYCKKVELTKKNQFLASGDVIIEWSEVAKVTGNEATGTIDKSGINQVKVMGNTHAVITSK